ncbi:MAG: TIGR00730 family Rossman fold protein [Candidatus Saccharimonadales bacterium]
MVQINTNTAELDTTNPDVIEKETSERRSRIDQEFKDGFEILNKHTNSVTIFGSARFKEGNEHYEQARAVGAALAREGYTIATGGGGGIMEGGNRGAFEAGGQSLGFNITLPHEQVLNTYTTDSMPFKYFFTRKVVLTFGAKGYVYLPGGFGTLDELFEVMTLMQTHKLPHVPIILVGSTFWNGLDVFIREHLLAGDRTISPGDEHIYTITDDVDEVVSLINNARDNDNGDVNVNDLHYTDRRQQ